MFVSLLLAYIWYDITKKPDFVFEVMHEGYVLLKISMNNTRPSISLCQIWYLCMFIYVQVLVSHGVLVTHGEFKNDIYNFKIKSYRDVTLDFAPKMFA